MANVAFSPCNHTACLGCVDRLRASNIFKADCGVRCPFCRQYIDKAGGSPGVPAAFSVAPHDARPYNWTQYDALDPSIAEASALAIANESAAKAAQSRRLTEDQGATAASAPGVPSNLNIRSGVVTPQALKVAAAGGPAASQGKAAERVQTIASQEWVCGKCAAKNFAFTPQCHKCKEKPPQAIVSAKARDLTRCSATEALALACEKFHPGLERAFAEAGVTFDFDRHRPGHIRFDGMEEALATKGAAATRLLLRINSLLCGSGQLKVCAMHMFGSYTVQDLIETGAHLRITGQGLGLAPEVMGYDEDGRDMLGQLIRALYPDPDTVAEYCGGTASVFVMIRTLEIISEDEAIDMAPAFCPKLGLICSRINSNGEQQRDQGQAPPSFPLPGMSLPETPCPLNTLQTKASWCAVG